MEQTMIRGGKKRVRSLAACVASALGTALSLLFLLLLIASLIAYRSDDPSSLIGPLSHGAALLSAFVGGLAASRLRGRQGLFCGALTGVGFLTLFLIGLAIFAGEDGVESGRLLFSYLSFFALSLLGGVLGCMRREGRRRRRYR